MANFVQNQGTHELMAMWSDYYPRMERRMPFFSLLDKSYTSGVKKNGYLAVSQLQFKDPLIREYNVFDGIPMQQSSSGVLVEVKADKDWAINELIDGHEAQAVPFDLIARSLEKAANETALFWENKSIESFTTGATSGTQSTQPKPDDTNAYQVILTDITQIFKQGVPLEDIRVVVSADTSASLLLDPKYTNSASDVGSQILRLGGNKAINGAPVVVSPTLNINYCVFNSKSAIGVDFFKCPLEINTLRDGLHICASNMTARFAYGFACLNKAMFLYNDK